MTRYVESGSTKSNDAALHSYHRRSRTVVYAHLRKDVLHMALNRLFTDCQSRSDFLVAESFGDQSQHFDLSGGELGLRQTVGECARNFRRNRAPSRVDGADRADKLFVRRVLGEKCYRAGL